MELSSYRRTFHKIDKNGESKIIPCCFGCCCSLRFFVFDKVLLASSRSTGSTSNTCVQSERLHFSPLIKKGVQCEEFCCFYNNMVIEERASFCRVSCDLGITPPHPFRPYSVAFFLLCCMASWFPCIICNGSCEFFSGVGVVSNKCLKR